jgi:mannitol/fructose-specific phosphotransferase system IIA component (Ntr-type)
VRSREALGSTGIGGGIAIPHAKTDHVTKIATAIAVTRQGIDYKAVDGEPCDIFFLVVSPKDRHETHLAVLRWLSRARKNVDFTRFLRMARKPEDVIAVLSEVNVRN